MPHHKLARMLKATTSTAEVSVPKAWHRIDLHDVISWEESTSGSAHSQSAAICLHGLGSSVVTLLPTRTAQSRGRILAVTNLHTPAEAGYDNDSITLLINF